MTARGVPPAPEVGSLMATSSSMRRVRKALCVVVFGAIPLVACTKFDAVALPMDASSVVDSAPDGAGSQDVDASDGPDATDSIPTAVFEFTGAAQTFIVPVDVDAVTVTAAGAAGNTDCYNGGRAGAPGAQVTATIKVTPGESLSIFVGGVGGKPGGVGGCPDGGAGGFNGGAPGGSAGPSQHYAGGGGGGASDVRRGGTLAERIVVAGGGGGSGGIGGLGGVGGGLVAPNGEPGFDDSLGGGGGTSTAGGAGGKRASYATADGEPGSLGAGGAGAPYKDSGGGGGGGGYYGGGGGGSGYGSAGGGGGSSFVVGGATDVSLQPGAHAGNGQVTIRY